VKLTKPFTVARWEFFTLATESILATVVVFMMMTRWMPLGLWKRGAFAAASYAVILVALLPAQNALSRHYNETSLTPSRTVTAVWLIGAALIGGIITVALQPR
jgi:hypothetical protein